MKKIIFIFLVAVLAACQSEKIDLSLNLEQGAEYQQHTNSKTTIVQDFNGQKMNMVMNVEGSMSFLVNNVNEDDYDMSVEYKNMSMSMELPQGTMEFSSENPNENDIFSKILASMTNKPFNVKMGKNGKIKEVTNMDALWESTISQFDSLPEMQKQQIKNQIMQAYGSEALKGNIEMVTAVYPNQPIDETEKWTVDTKLESGMSANITNEYELTELNEEFAMIKGTSKIATEDKDAYQETNGMQLKYNLSGTMNSEVKVDRATGWIIDSKIEQEIKGDADIKESPQLPEGMKIPMRMTSVVKITNSQ